MKIKHLLFYSFSYQVLGDLRKPQGTQLFPGQKLIRA